MGVPNSDLVLLDVSLQPLGLTVVRKRNQDDWTLVQVSACRYPLTFIPIPLMPQEWQPFDGEEHDPADRRRSEQAKTKAVQERQARAPDKSTGQEHRTRAPDQSAG